MKIKILSPVEHDGHRAEPGQTGDLEEAIAKQLIASGVAEAVEEAKAAPAPTGNETKPEAGSAGPKTVPAAGPETKTEPKVAAADAATTTETPAAAETKATEAETGKKAAKAEGK